MLNYKNIIIAFNSGYIVIAITQQYNPWIRFGAFILMLVLVFLLFYALGDMPKTQTTPPSEASINTDFKENPLDSPKVLPKKAEPS